MLLLSLKLCAPWLCTFFDAASVFYAGKSVAMALTPAVPPIHAVSTLGRGTSMASIRFTPVELDRGGWLTLTAPGVKVRLDFLLRRALLSRSRRVTPGWVGTT